jgi:hypoxanthine phosphoribosyltransferase
MMEKPAVLFSAEQIERRVRELGAEIARAYAGEEIAVVGLMKSCLVFMADLIRAIPLDLTVHMVRATQSGKGGTEIVYSAEVPYAGRHILLIDDIVDTGVTLGYLVDHIKDHSPKSLKVVALIDNVKQRKLDVAVDWSAFELTDSLRRFIVGYGLDWAEQYRGLPYLGTISQPAPPAAGGSLNMSLE